MKRRGLRILLALCVGATLVGLAAVLVRVSELTNFYKICFWLGVIVLGLAVAALYSLAKSPTRGARHPSGDPDPPVGWSAPLVGVSDTERRNTAWGSVYLAAAALPRLLTAALHYWA